MTAQSLPIETVFEIRDSCLCFASQRAARLLARQFDRLFAPLGITNGQFSILVALSGPWSPKLGELAQFLAMDTTTMTAAVKPLERNGLVTLAQDQKDRRIRRPAITDAGRAVLEKAVPLWRAEHRKVQDSLLPDNAMLLAQSLSRLGRDEAD